MTQISLLLYRLLTLTTIVCICIMPCLSAQDIQINCGIVFTSVDGEQLQLDMYRPLDLKDPLPVIFIVHGGFWQEGRGDRTQVKPLAELVAGEGFAVLAMDYRLLPRYTFPAQIDDVRAAIAWAVEHADVYHFDPSRLITIGLSAGGQLAALAALDMSPRSPRISGVISFFGPMDFTVSPPNLAAKIVVEQYLGGSKRTVRELYERASPITFVSAQAPPFLFIHGTKDALVPFRQSERMANALRDAGVPVVVYPIRGGGHEVPAATSPEGQQLFHAVVSFLNERTLPTSPASDRTRP